MKTKHLHAISVVLLLLVVGTQPALGTRYIPSDPDIGTWDEVNRIYTLTTDVYEDTLYTVIEIEEDNITLDGAGHTVTGSGTGYGIRLSERTGVTVTDVSVEEFYIGIGLHYSDNNTVTSNVTNSNTYGIYLRDCSSNTVTGNTVEWSGYIGIALQECSNTTLTGNVATNNPYGIRLWMSSDNTVTDNTLDLGSQGIVVSNGNSNTVADNTVSNLSNGIYIQGPSSSDNVVTNNTVNNNHNGIRLESCSNTTVTGNTTNSHSGFGIGVGISSHHTTITGNMATDNFIGISISASSDNEIYDNNLSGNAFAIKVGGSGPGNRYLNNDLSNSTSSSLHISHDSEFELSGNDFTNSVNGIALLNMDGASLSNVDLSSIAGGIGVELWGVTNSSFSYITVSGGQYGIRVWQGSTGNTFHNNTISDNTRGMHISYSSNDNIIYNNNFINNATQAHVDGSSASVFNLDKPIGGNYWSDWTSPDTDNDGFVDFPYEFSGGQRKTRDSHLFFT